MKNSFNIAGFSEVLHEIRHDPAEAGFSYSTIARFVPGRGVAARTRPALLGTVKATRNFLLAVSETGTSEAEEPGPLDLALTGIAACSLTTLVGGGSARGMTFDAAEMRIEYGGTDDSTRSGQGAVRCHFDVSGDHDPEAVSALVEHVRQSSPNLQTLIKDIPLTVGCTDGAGETIEAMPQEYGVPERLRHGVGRNVRWISGTQFESHPLADGGGPILRVDQPKQITGVDWGPNPQEYLLMGLAADLALQLGRSALQVMGKPLTWEVVTEAYEDVRGLLNAEPDAIVHLQDVACTVSLAGRDAGKPVPADLVRDALAKSHVRDIICRTQPIAVSVWAERQSETLNGHRPLLRGRRGNAATP